MELWNCILSPPRGLQIKQVYSIILTKNTGLYTKYPTTFPILSCFWTLEKSYSLGGQLGIINSSTMTPEITAKH